MSKMLVVSTEYNLDSLLEETSSQVITQGSFGGEVEGGYAILRAG